MDRLLIDYSTDYSTNTYIIYFHISYFIYCSIRDIFALSQDMPTK